MARFAGIEGKSYTSAMAAPGSGGRLVALPLAWLAGVAVQLQQRELWRFESYLAVTIIAVAVALISARSRRAFALLVAAALATGFALTGIQASARLAETLPPALEGRDVVVTGVVANLPQQGPSGLRFRFEVDPGGAPAGVPRVIALGWYAGFHEDAALVQPRLALRAGQRWRFTVRLRQPHGNLNLHGFDYELALLEQGVAPPATCATRRRRSSTRAPGIRSSGCVSAFATRSTRTSTTAVPPACWRRSPSTTRARSSVTTGTCSATPASLT